MSDTLTIHEIVKTTPTDLLAWSVMHLLSLGPIDFLQHFGIDASNHDNTVKVELRINGIEVSPREVFDELNRQHTEMVKRQAMAILESKVSLHKVSQMASNIESLVMREAADALGANWEDR